MKRKNEEMQGELSNLRQLYDFLRLRPEQEAMEVLKRIRSNSPDVPPTQRIQELADFVRHGDLLLQQPVHTPPLSSHERDPVQSVTLPPLRQALDSPSASESYILSYPSIHSMGYDGPVTQRRRHTQDLSARTDGQSSLPRPTSIEAILQTPSSAAVDHLAADPRLGKIMKHLMVRQFHSSSVKDRNKPFSESSIQTSFYHEARRLWDLEEGRDSLTKVQAGAILSLFSSECALHMILLDCVGIIQDTEGAGIDDVQGENRVEASYSRLRAWWNSRSGSLDPDKFPSQVHLLCALQYNVNVVKLFQPVLNCNTSSGHAPPYVDRARSEISTSLREMRRLIALHDTHHGWSNAITFVLQGITVASFGTLDEMSDTNRNLAQSDHDEQYRGLVTCLRALTVLLSYSYYAQPLFRLLTQKCRALGVQLPIEVQGALDYCTSEDWTKKAAELVSSQYIADTRTVAESSTMDAVISSWESFTLDDKQPWVAQKGKKRADA
ncbi:hypothetical protein N0V94_008111 [Neodidymelliopsis sp. IMI 364377]|nr:hypothetical protein N0V94_008111 [Neodidymelliopsis sp. IMI 364377]